jgi:hypothetical protein
MPTKKTLKPEPVAISTICSVCGLSWLEHGKDPTTDDCIRLLKAALAIRPITIPTYPVYPHQHYREEPLWPKRHEPYEIIYGESAEKGLQEYKPMLAEGNGLSL